MYRRNRFLTGLVSAAITFATLTALAGPMHWQRRGWHRGHYYQHCDYSSQEVNKSYNQR